MWLFKFSQGEPECKWKPGKGNLDKIWNMTKNW